MLQDVEEQEMAEWGFKKVHIKCIVRNVKGTRQQAQDPNPAATSSSSEGSKSDAVGVSSRLVEPWEHLERVALVNAPAEIVPEGAAAEQAELGPAAARAEDQCDGFRKHKGLNWKLTEREDMRLKLARREDYERLAALEPRFDSMKCNLKMSKSDRVDDHEKFAESAGQETARLLLLAENTLLPSWWTACSSKQNVAAVPLGAALGQLLRHCVELELGLKMKAIPELVELGARGRMATFQTRQPWSRIGPEAYCNDSSVIKRAMKAMQEEHRDWLLECTGKAKSKDPKVEHRSGGALPEGSECLS
jgi:hypothetical protein